jgi:hypothetical protein
LLCRRLAICERRKIAARRRLPVGNTAG